MHWRVKGVVQKVLGHTPGGRDLHYRLQRRVGGLRDFDREFGLKMEDWSIMSRHLRDAGYPIADTRFLEIGTGWYPTFPLACALGGAARVDTFDLNAHLRADLVAACVERLGTRIDVIAAGACASPDAVANRHEGLARGIARGDDIATASSGVVACHAPADATRTGLADASIDVVFSNSVLEHIPPEVIHGLFEESWRVLRPGGAMFHSVNCGDHYAYVDRNIHQLNYLRYSDRAWRRWNNAFLYQNRMRAHEFVDGARAAGFDVVLDTSHARPQRLAQLAAMRVHPQFASVPAEQLCITTIDFIARKPG